MCESYNGHLVKTRNKYILRMLEWMRVDVMNRLYTKRDDVMKWCTDVSPSTIERLDKNMDRASQCIIEWNGEHGYEISEGRDRHTVDIEKCSSTYRAWDSYTFS